MNVSELTIEKVYAAHAAVAPPRVGYWRLSRDVADRIFVMAYREDHDYSRHVPAPETGQLFGQPYRIVPGEGVMQFSNHKPAPKHRTMRLL